MKWVKILLACGIVAGGSYFTPAMSQVVVQHEVVTVPVTLQKSFTTKYPTATQVVWYRYMPGTTKAAPEVWYYTMDEKDYYATFLMDDADYVAWFDEGTWIRSTHNIDNADLPLPVQKAINASYPGYTITDVDLDDFKGMEVYEVTMEKGMSRVQVEYRPNGTAVKTKDRSGTKVDVANVTDAMESDFATRYPEATTVTWYRYIPRDRVEVVATDWDYDMDANDYEVRYTMSGTPYVAFYDNGTWIRTESVTFDKGSLPAVVSSAIRRDYAGYTIEDVNMEDFKGAQVYEVELNSTTMGRCKIHYKMDGSIAKQKCVKNGVKTKS